MPDEKTPFSHTGLTEEQVREQISRGLVNGDYDVKTKSYARILKEHALTLFNLINVILFVCILFSGSLKNALFFLVVIWNFIIGVVQEIRAKKTIEKLSLLSAPKAYVLRDGTIREIPVKDIVLRDLMQLKTGNQICADSVVVEGSCQVNESLLTGESTPVYKKTGDHLLSGSFLVSGQVLAETEHIGADNYVQKITAGAKYVKKTESVIMQSVQKIVRIIAICIFPVAALLVWSNFFRSAVDFSEAMIKMVAAVSSLIPGGLVLLVSVVLAVSVVRLSAHKTLVQDLYCVENLARVDMLLLDKTGTITEGKMNVESVIDLSAGNALMWDADTDSLIAVFVSHMRDDNSTANALRAFVKEHPDRFCGKSVFSSEETEVSFIPFSSDRKWSLVNAPGTGSLFMGAPEYLLEDPKDPVLEKIRAYTDQGKRVLLFAASQECGIQESENARLPKQRMPLALIVIGDKIRANAPQTLRYFEEEGVSLKVISGDAPETVSRIAQEAGVPQADQWVDAQELKDVKELQEAALRYTIFGRVTPDQKYEIVKTLKANGHVVAMTGDGANDVLALREADCSIAMQSGSDAARNVSNLVLLDSDFSSLPLVVAEGRKSINNLQRSSALYLTKTTYAFVFALFFILVTTVTYPFENIQVTLIGAVTIGIPSFFLALEPNKERVRSGFLHNVLLMAVPSGLLEAAALLVLQALLKYRTAADAGTMETGCVYLMLIMGILVIIQIAGRLNLWKICMLLLLGAVSVAAVLLFPELFSLVPVSMEIWKVILPVAAGFFVILMLLYRMVLPMLQKRKQGSKKSV